MSDDVGTPAPEDQPDWALWSSDTLHAPDDISSLRADVVAFQREARARRRRQRWSRLLGWGQVRGFGISIPMIMAALLVVAGLGALLVLLSPSGAERPSGDVSVGRPGGPILPVQLAQTDGRAFPATSIASPAAVLLVPARCSCGDTVPALVRAAVGAGLHAYVVEPTPPDGDRVARVLGGTATALVDRPGALLADYGSLDATPTLLRLDQTGRVREVRTGVTAADAAAAVLGG